MKLSADMLPAGRELDAAIEMVELAVKMLHEKRAEVFNRESGVITTGNVKV